MSAYQATVDATVRNASHTLMLELIGSNRTVLDVGCASGYLAEALQRSGSRVSGVEYNPDDADKARPFLEQLVVADLNQVDLAAEFPAASFDTLVFGDVLEHLLDPARVLRSALELLTPDGTVIISIPNVAHGALRLTLLQGNWKYRDTGLLDATHIRWFTLDTLRDMLRSVGLAITELRSTVADPVATEIPIDGDDLPLGAVDWVRRQSTASDYQFVLAARRRGVVGDAEASEVVPALVADVVDDVHTERARRLAVAEHALADPDSAAGTISRLEHDLLTSRDSIIGANAQIGALRARLVAVNRALGLAHQELERTHQALGASLADATHAHTELGKSIADGQAAHAELSQARTEVQQVHERLAAALHEGDDRRRELERVRAEVAELRARESSQGAELTLGRRLRRVAGRVKRAVAGVLRGQR